MVSADGVRSIKVAVDTEPRPGQFLLITSAQVLAMSSTEGCAAGPASPFPSEPLASGSGQDHLRQAVLTTCGWTDPTPSRHSLLCMAAVTWRQSCAGAT